MGLPSCMHLLTHLLIVSNGPRFLAAALVSITTELYFCACCALHVTYACVGGSSITSPGILIHSAPANWNKWNDPFIYTILDSI